MKNKLKSSFYNIIPIKRKNKFLFLNKNPNKLLFEKLINSNNKIISSQNELIYNKYNNKMIFEGDKYVHSNNNKSVYDNNINIKNNFKNDKEKNLNKSDNNLFKKNIYNNSEEKYKNIIKLNQKSRLKRIYKPYWFENVEEIIEKESNDSKIPKGLEYINLLIKNYNKKSDLLNYEIYKKRMNKSDIFFINEKNEENFFNNYTQKYKKLVNFNNDSDIFLIKNDDNSIKKSGEICFNTNKNVNKIKYSANSESKTGWGLKVLKPSLINCNSSDRNLFNYRIKNINHTRKEIENDCKLRHNNFNPTFKQKGLSEFYDLTNRKDFYDNNQDYLEKYNQYPNIFHKNEDFCNESFKIYKSYKNLLDEPFKRFRKKFYSL